MIPWEFLESAQAPGNGEELRLYRRGREFSIRVNGCELMNSCAHGSEEALAELACANIADRPCSRVLIGGLGMGYTTAAALHRLGAETQVVVAELVPAVQADHEADRSDLPLRAASSAHQNPRSMQFPINSRDLRSPVVRQS